MGGGGYVSNKPKTIIRGFKRFYSFALGFTVFEVSLAVLGPNIVEILYKYYKIINRIPEANFFALLYFSSPHDLKTLQTFLVLGGDNYILSLSRLEGLCVFRLHCTLCSSQSWPSSRKCLTQPWAAPT